MPTVHSMGLEELVGLLRQLCGGRVPIGIRPLFLEHERIRYRNPLDRRDWL